MRRLLIILGIFTSCASYNTDKLKVYNYQVVKNAYPTHSIKEFRRFSYIFDVYNSKDSIKVFINRDFKIYKKINLK